MSNSECFSLITGAILGAVLGFVISEFKLFLMKLRFNRKFKKHFKPYFGTYRVKSKNGDEVNYIVTLSYHENNILKYTSNSENTGKAEGHIIIDKTTLSSGTLFYHHKEDEHIHRSGFYNILFVDNGIIHALNSYIDTKTGKQMIIQYIWENTGEKT